MTLDPRLTAALADRYRLDRELGQGGMATVYLAQDLKHDRKVAIKVLRPELAAVIGAERFLREIKTIASLQHPHILGLIDSGIARVGSQKSEVGAEDPEASDSRLPTSDLFVYYVMPFVEGESLRDRLIREKQLPVSDAVRLATEVASALDYAHRHGVIHRDIKPENILLHDGRALVADFGIALAVSSAGGGSRMTETGMSLGTPHYMSPEQAMGEREITARSDVYALGCVTYEMLIGEPPFTGPTAQAIIAKVMTTEPVSLMAQRKSVPPVVEDAVLMALAKLPADRFGSAADFAAALGGQPGSLAGGRTRQSQPAGPPARLWLLVTALMATLALAAWGWFRPAPAPGPVVYDATLPDSAPISLAITSSNTAYGEPLRNISISAAGDFAVYAARQGDSTELWYRSLRNGDARRLPGTRGATAPRISPDGTRVVFLRADRVMLLSLAGGDPRLLLDSRSTDAVGWMSNTQLGAGSDDGNRFNWIDAAGGTSRTTVGPRCPFGRWNADLQQLFCSYNRNAIVLNPESGAVANIRAARADGSAGDLLTGSAFLVIDRKYLIYLTNNGSLIGARYDAGKYLASAPVTMLTGIRREALGEGQFDVSASGTLVYAPGIDATIGHIVALHADGRPQPLPVESADFQRFDLSRDRRWLAAAVQGSESNELRVYDLKNGQHSTWRRGGWIRHPLWNPAGDALLFAKRDSSRWVILRGAPGAGGRPDTLLSEAYSSFSLDPDDFYGDHLALAQSWGGSIVTRFDPGVAHPTFDTIATGARFGSVSPNQKLLLYQTLEGNQVVVTSFPVPGRRWQVASEGVEPIWLSATDVLFRLGNAWYLAKVNPETGEPQGAPTFWGRDPRFSDTSGWSNRPSHDGGILYVQGPAETSATYLRVIPNWVAQMKAAVDAGNH